MNEQDKQANTRGHRKRMVVTRGKGVAGSEWDQMHGGGRRLDFGW